MTKHAISWIKFNFLNRIIFLVILLKNAGFMKIAQLSVQQFIFIFLLINWSFLMWCRKFKSTSKCDLIHQEKKTNLTNNERKSILIQNREMWITQFHENDVFFSVSSSLLFRHGLSRYAQTSASTIKAECISRNFFYKISPRTPLECQVENGKN